MPLRSAQRRHGGLLLLLVLLLLVAIHATHAAQHDVVSRVRAYDDSAPAVVAGNADAVFRTLRPATSIANEADGGSLANAAATPKPATTPKGDALSADDAVNAALKTAAPPTFEPAATLSPPTLAPSIVVSNAPTMTPTVTSVVPIPTADTVTATSVPPTAIPKSPRATTATPPPATADSSATSADADATRASKAPAPTRSSSVDADQLSKDTGMETDALSNSHFDEVIVVSVLGGVGAIAVVVAVMSRKIAKETGDDAALREASSFAHL